MDIPTVFDSQILSGIEKCLRYYQLKYVDGWTAKKPNDHIIFGGHFAKALERFYKMRAESTSIDEALIEVVRLALVESYGWESMDNSKTRENLIRSIVWYVDQFAKEQQIKLMTLANGMPAVEYSFRMEIDYGNVLCGHIDRLVDYSGHYYIMDQKTTASTVTGRYFDNYSPDTQMSLYTWAGQAIYELPVRGVIIDVCQVAVGFSRFERGFTFRTPRQLEEWYDHTLYWIGEAQAAVENNFFPQNRQSCGMFGGCEFRHVCSRSPEVRHAVLKGDFEQREPWDPLKPR